MRPQLLTRELLRAWRGRRSRDYLSRRLGYRSNVLFDWESGRRAPTAAKAVQVAAHVGVDVGAAVERFFRRPLPWLEQHPLTTDSGIAELCRELKSKTSIVELANRLGESRFSVGRWLSGGIAPTFAQVLAVVDVTTLRLLDFAAELADPHDLPTIAAEWQRLEAARELAYESPWSHAVLRALELESYRRLPRHQPGFIARHLGISLAEERRQLELLKDTGQITLEDDRWKIDEQRLVDTRFDPERSRRLRAFWSDVAAERLRQGGNGEFSFNLFGVSAADHERLEELQRAYFAQLRKIVAESQPVERVVLANFQLFRLSG